MKLSVLLFLLLLAKIEAESQDLNPLLIQNLKVSARLNHYDYDHFNRLRSRTDVSFQQHQKKVKLMSKDSQWEVQLDISPFDNQSNILEVSLDFHCIEGESQEASLSVDLSFEDWSTDNYVLMPGAIYNGNRFPYRRIRYSPKLLDPRDIGPDIAPIISDVPKLNIGSGPSRIQQRTGDMTTPSIGFWAPNQKKGFFLLTDVATRLGDSGIDIEESRDRKKATISLTAPVVREVYKYRITDNRFPSDDKGANFKAGDSLNIKFRVHFFEAPELQDFFNYFTQIRKSYINNGKHRLILPLSSAFEVQEKKFNELNWEPNFGYYSVGPRNMFLQDWQIGWTGGMISTFPLLWMGNENTQQRVIQNFDWLFPDGLAPSGLFWDSGAHGNKWYGGDIRKPHTANWHLIRKTGDGLYYIIKQLMLMKKMGIPIKDSWEKGSKGAALALLKIWKEEKQFGQFVDNPSGKVRVGGSTSGGIIPAALVLAYQYFGEESFLEVAKSSAEYYYENFVKKGLTTGGPGDALQNPDSESCYALIESFALLYETTQNKKWLTMGEDIARQFATWVISYNYSFPKTSLFGKEGMYSLGAVNANTQNKHGAPGICTHSGLALLRLFRATNDNFYAELLQDIARNMPQYLPHPQKPIEGAKIGWMCERISTTDWLEGIGEISYLTTWSETALMLTYVEIPGLYVQPDRSFFIAFDNIEAKKKTENSNTWVLSLSNPTKMEAKVKVLVENTSERAKALGELALWDCQVITLQPNEQKDITFSKK